jgi:hypothetical protein
MRSINFRLPLLAGAAFASLVVSPAFAETATAPMALTDGAVAPLDIAVEAPIEDAAPIAFADEAAEKDDMQADMMKLADTMADPRMQDNMANMLNKMTQTMMKLPIGNMVAGIEKAVPGQKLKMKGKRIRQGDTIADLAGRDAKKLPGEIDKGVRQAMGMMSGFAAAFATMLPELEKMGDTLEKSFEDIEAAQEKRD